MSSIYEKELDFGGAVEFNPMDCVIRYRDQHGNAENSWNPEIDHEYFTRCKEYFPEFRFLSLCQSHENSDVLNQKLIELDNLTEGLVEAAVDWILDGWELEFFKITLPMLAAALFNEANSSDDDAVRGISDKDYPGRLRAVAYEILKIAGHEEKKGKIGE